MEKVFVYGTLKKGYHNHKLLKSSKFLGEAKTNSNNFTLIDLGPYPGVVESGSSKIHGELYEVTDEIFKRLDCLEGYPDFYNRSQITINVKEQYYQAWIYTLPIKYLNNKIIETGIWYDSLIYN